MPTAIVLSGGGSKGDFEIGAVRALFNRGIRPDILCGTSVGAINAATIAQGSNGLDQLESIWLGLQQDSDMWLEDPAFAALDQQKKFFLHLVGPDLLPGAINPIGGLVAPFLLFERAISLQIDLTQLGVALSQVAFSKALYSLKPIKDRLGTQLDSHRVATSGIKLRVAVVSLESGKLRFINELGQFIDDHTQVDLKDAILASASVPFIFAPVPLGSENFVDGGIRTTTPIQAALDAGADRVFAIVASRGGVDPKPSFTGANIVDIAQRAASDIMPDTIQQDGVSPPRGWGSSVQVIQPDTDVHNFMVIDPGLIRIARDYGYMRAAEILDIKVSDIIGIVRLLAISQLSRQITEKRVAIWNLEFSCNGERSLTQQVIDPHIHPVPSPDSLQAVRRMKLELKSLIEQRQQDIGLHGKVLANPLTLDFGGVPVGSSNTMTVLIQNIADAGTPPGFDAWWKQWEAHSWRTVTPTPWDLFISVAGDVPAATPPDVSLFVGDLQIGSVVIADSQFSAHPPFFTIPPGQSATLTVTFTPASVKITQTTLTLNSNDLSNAAQVITLQGEGRPVPPTIFVDPVQFSFGTVIIGSPEILTVTLENKGTSKLQINSLQLTQTGVSNAFSYSAPATPFTIDSFQTVPVRITFAPQSPGLFSGTLTIQSNDATHGTVTVQMEGSGRPKKVLPPPK